MSLSPVFRFTLHAVDSRGGQSESSFVSVRTSCPMVDDSRAEGTTGVATVRPHVSFIAATRKTFFFRPPYSIQTSLRFKPFLHIWTFSLIEPLCCCWEAAGLVAVCPPPIPLSLLRPKTPLLSCPWKPCVTHNKCIKPRDLFCKFTSDSTLM